MYGNNESMIFYSPSLLCTLPASLHISSFFSMFLNSGSFRSYKMGWFCTNSINTSSSSCENRTDIRVDIALKTNQVRLTNYETNSVTQAYDAIDVSQSSQSNTSSVLRQRVMCCALQENFNTKFAWSSGKRNARVYFVVHDAL